MDWVQGKKQNKKKEERKEKKRKQKLKDVYPVGYSDK